MDSHLPCQASIWAPSNSPSVVTIPFFDKYTGGGGSLYVAGATDETEHVAIHF